MRPRIAAIALAGLVSVAAALVLYRPFIVADQPAATVLPEPEPPALSASPAEPARIRPVAPEVARPFVDPQELERLEPREPLSPAGRAQDPSEAPPRETTLHRPVAMATGLFEAQGHTVALAGIVPTDVGETCGGNGGSWPCGVHARTAFRNWLRGRALTCVVPRVPVPEVTVSHCTLGGQNPAEWLVGQGWARAAPDGPYIRLEEEARVNKRGIFGPAPSGG